MFQNLFRSLIANFAATLSAQDKLLSVVATFIAILIVAYVGFELITPYQHPVLVASMGASALLLLVIPNSPLAQPYPFVMGHLAPAFVGVVCARLFNDIYLGAAFTVSLSLLAMYLLNCLHPPGGAAALVPIISADHQALGFEYLLLPVLINVVTMLVLAILMNKYLLKKEYPVRLERKKGTDHHHADPNPMGRLGIRSEDMRAALKDFNAYLNITENDLAKLYNDAQSKAYTRKFGEVRCKDIMSKDVRTVEFGTDLEEAWALLRFHKVKILPVVDKVNRVVGVISLVDFLKRADLKTYDSFAEKLIGFIRKSTTIHTEKPEAVGQIMASPAFTVSEDAYIASLVPLLSDRGLHHIPVVNSEHRLVGIITQSDLIGALYAGSLSNAA